MTRPPRLVVPRGRTPVPDQVRHGSVPRLRLGHRERPPAHAERPDARPRPADLLPTRADDVLEVSERDLDGSAIMPPKVELGAGRPTVSRLAPESITSAAVWA